MTKISQLSSIGDSLAVGDQFLIRDIDDAGSPNKSVTVSGITRALDLGTAAAPAIAFATDKNSGIFSPGADQVAISTNGTGRLFVDATGNIGIGASPAFQLDLNRSGSPVFRITNGTIAGYMQPEPGSGSVRIGSLSNHPLAFIVNSSEVSRFDTSGRLGLGTSAPTGGGLNVSSNTAPGIVLQRTDLTANQDDIVQIFRFLNGGAASNYSADILGYQSTAFPDAIGLQFRTKNGGTSDPTTRLTINGAGNVGIGTTSPSYRLHVDGGTGVGATQAYFGSSGGHWELVNVGNPTARVILRGYNSAAEEKIRLDPSATSWLTGGNVGIGVDNPGERLVVSGGCLQVRGALSAIDRPSSSVMDFFGGTTRFFSIGADSSTHGQLVFHTSTTTSALERARIDSSGRLLVGTSSSSADTLFRVQGKQSSSASNGVVQIARGQTNPASDNGLGSIQFTDVAGSVGASITAETELNWGASDYPSRLVFFTTADNAASPTERLRITSAGVLQVADAGNITVGTTTGTKIGTATTQKLGFYNKTPVVQPIAVADATDAASAITQLNALLARMRDLGLIAT